MQACLSRLVHMYQIMAEAYKDSYLTCVGNGKQLASFKRGRPGRPHGMHGWKRNTLGVDISDEIQGSFKIRQKRSKLLT